MPRDLRGEAYLSALVTAQACAVQRGQAHLIDPVDLEIGPGEFILLAGPNGAGKSTLVRLLARLVRPSEGKLKRRAGLRVGYVPQHPQRDPTLPLSVGNFLGFPRSGEREQEILSILRVEPLGDRPLAALSGGELRRVALARALLRKPNLLLLDEPLAGIDLASQEPILALLASEVMRSDAGLLLVAHEILIALPFVSRLVLLDRSIAADGTPEEVVESEAFAERFGVVNTEAARHVLSDHPAMDTS